MSFRGRVPKLCKRQLSARPGVAISYSPSIPPRRPVIKSLSREGRRTGGEPFTHSTHSPPPQGDQIPQPGGSPRWRGTFLCGAAVWRSGGVAKSGAAVWRKAVLRCGGNGGVAKSGAAERRKAVLRCGGCFERRCGGNAVRRCGGNCGCCGKTDALVRQNCCPAELQCCCGRSHRTVAFG